MKTESSQKIREAIAYSEEDMYYGEITYHLTQSLEDEAKKTMEWSKEMSQRKTIQEQKVLNSD